MNPRDIETPLRKYVKLHRSLGEKAVQLRIMKTFLRRGWHATGPQISQWCSGNRFPRLETQLRIEVATNGEVKPVHWLQYRRELLERANRTPSKETSKRSTKQKRQ
jgi:hypothetical protein